MHQVPFYLEMSRYSKFSPTQLESPVMAIGLLRIVWIPIECPLKAALLPNSIRFSGRVFQVFQKMVCVLCWKFWCPLWVLFLYSEREGVLPRWGGHWSYSLPSLA